jgi:putative pyruvate formate lyase activating enzyme
MGRVVEDGEFVRICRALQEKGAENINIVTGSHAAPALARGLAAARSQGLVIPVLWNCSGYEGPHVLSLLCDTVDVYLPDLKTLGIEEARRFFNAQDYPDRAKAAILRMMEHRELRYSEDGTVLVSGVMIRHLVIPGFLEATRGVLRWFAENAQGRALLSVMTQYTPAGAGYLAPERYIREDEYEAVIGWLVEFGITEGFCQELVTGSDWLPDFSRVNPFTSVLSTPIWHWREGFIPY